jgi:CheY-like chemotaxis protein
VSQPAVVAGLRSAKAPMTGALMLCIDNEPSILDGMRTLLGGWGASVITASDAASAIALIAADGRVPTGILVDYHLDHSTGIEAIGEIRRAFGDGIPAVLITADRGQEVRDAARADGIPVINKPVKPAALRALLAQWRAQQLVAAE